MCGAWNKRKLLNRSKMLCKLLYHMDHLIQQTQWDLRYQWQIGMLFGAFGRSPISESQKRHWDFGARLCHYLQSTILSERQLLTCYWALLETKCLTTGHQVTM